MSAGEARDDIEADAPLARALAPYLEKNRAGTGGVLLAVSGGPDSTALLHAAAAFRESTPITVATVDHGLRPGSGGEAQAVGALAHELGLDHRILPWGSPQPVGIQAAARAARYRLLAAHAAAIGAGLVLTAHTRDDQAETVLMRLMAGSGPAGLAGMRRERALVPGIRLARPFLDLPKAGLVAYCGRHGLPVLQDPSNVDHRFARARLRALMPVLAVEGLGTGRLCRLAERLARDEAALSHAANETFRAARRPSAPGTLALDGRRLRAVPEAVALRVIDLSLDALQPVAIGAAPRRLERLERLVLDALLPALAAGIPLRRTLRGIVVEATRDEAVRLAPAPARRGLQVGQHARHHAGHADHPRVRRAAGGSDLLGKAEGAAYIGPECPE